MKNNILYLLLILPLAVIFSGCWNKKLNYVPSVGVATYEVHYSKEMKGEGAASMFFPREIECRYNENGIRFRTEGGMGMCVINIVSTVDNGFVALGLEKHRRYAVMFKELMERPEAAGLADSIVIKPGEYMQEVNGWMSESFHAKVHTKYGIIDIDAFYVPMECKNRLAYSPIEQLPGLITGMSISYGDYNMMFSLTDLTDKRISDNEFVLPDGYSQVSPEELVRQLMSMIK